MRRPAADRLVAVAALIGGVAGLCVLSDAKVWTDRAEVLLAVAGCVALVAGAMAVRRWPPVRVLGAVGGAGIVAVTLLGHVDAADWSERSGVVRALLVLAPIALVLAPWVASRTVVAARPPGSSSPWQLLSANAEELEEIDRELRARGRAAAASGLALGAVLWPLTLVAEDSESAIEDRAGLGLAVAVALLALAAIPLLQRERASRKRLADEHRRSLERQVVAAHLHDSVLQTLSLIQRTDDPDRVRSLARQQERSLRAWLAGRDERAGSTLASAITAVCAEVEDEVLGATVHCVTVSDAALDDRTSPLVWAVREAVRNAVRHAGGEVHVFLEVDEAEAVAYVRDTGPGFALDTVPSERRGVRDAILGRVELAGGRAQIESGPGGTEVELRLPLTATEGAA